MIRQLIRNIIPYQQRKQLHDFLAGFFCRSYSQEGEDMVVRRLLQGRTNGFYVDVGAHHPKRFSNTYFFYRQGWRGINIDAMPDSMKAFGRQRPRDINLEIPVAATSQPLTYYAFAEPAYNGFSESISKERMEAGYQLLFQKEILTRRLDTILDQYLPAGQTIDFISVDVEGLDMDVLKSNNWQKYRPSAVVVEAYGSTLADVLQSEVYQFLKGIGYEAMAKTMNTCIFTLQQEQPTEVEQEEKA